MILITIEQYYTFRISLVIGDTLYRVYAPSQKRKYIISRSKMFKYIILYMLCIRVIHINLYLC
jgi:hypothetical protein